MFELIGLLGEKIQFKHILEFIFVFGLAKISRTIATLLLQSIPTKSALIVKGALAYAFTWAIGEAIVYLIVARQRVGWHFILQRVKCHYGSGLACAKDMVKNRQ
ncbi:3-phosphoglycerate kinase [Sporomusaceae bacterium BoRhaA]|uniref:hypothetical protein n=1 Tax=Pelorhabdus rhamnosifermentans TaxID=2772457 RepID=UPI001C05F7A2|nr:hypothetical protein [Pelorhabdus rhamnosifermentans]MBU2703820.1 3-phosphoglycerate kinase [Pelorhabdus rhamnosifermentans]